MSYPFTDPCCWWHRLKSFLRYPLCECHFDCRWIIHGDKGQPPGRVIMGGCKWHD